MPVYQLRNCRRRSIGDCVEPSARARPGVNNHSVRMGFLRRCLPSSSSEEALEGPTNHLIQAPVCTPRAVESYGDGTSTHMVSSQEKKMKPERKVGPVGAANKSKFPKVSFAHVEFRDYDVVLGDHPCCSCGPPVTLGWDYSSERKVHIDAYEHDRGPRRRGRGMTMDYQTRKNILLTSGACTEAEIRRVERRMSRAKTQKSLVDLFKVDGR